MAKIAFIGLGKMGLGMAGRLLAAGHHLTIHNRTPSKAAALVRVGADLCASPAQAARDADAVISMVADDTPVTGIPENAAAGELTLLVGAQIEDLDAARNILGAFSGASFILVPSAPRSQHNLYAPSAPEGRVLRLATRR